MMVSFRPIPLLFGLWMAPVTMSIIGVPVNWAAHMLVTLLVVLLWATNSWRNKVQR